MIVLYVYNKLDGLLLYKATGMAEYIIHDLKEGEDFTLETYPPDGNRYKWNGLEWVKDGINKETQLE